ncbi:MAG TPA: response regulator [Telluria sp.]|jgi:CheY-like chemotaxis protein
MNKTILIVDDDADIRAVLSEFLEFENYTVSTAANGREALAFLRAHPRTSVVLLDLMMPIMDGFQFREEQKRDPAIASVPVVVMTASGSLGPGSIDVDQVLAKPLELDRLLAALDSARGAR